MEHGKLCLQQLMLMHIEDDEFNVIKKLGYKGKETRENIYKNLNKMLNKLNDLEKDYS